MLVYDITNAKSFENISKWLRNIDEVKRTHKAAQSLGVVDLTTSCRAAWLLTSRVLASLLLFVISDVTLKGTPANIAYSLADLWSVNCDTDGHRHSAVNDT